MTSRGPLARAVLGLASLGLVASASVPSSGGEAHPSDSRVRAPSGYSTLKPPAAEGGSYADPVFGTTVRRLSDATKILASNPANINALVGNEYASINAINADNSVVYLMIGLGGKRLYSVNGGLATKVSSDVCGTLPLQMRWSHTDPNVLYYVEPEAWYYTGPDVPGPSFIKSVNVKTCEVKVLHTFPQYVGLYLTSADLSPDGTKLPILANGRYAFWYDVTTDTVGPVIDRVSRLGFDVGAKGGQQMLGKVFTIFNYYSSKYPMPSLLVFDAATMTYRFNITELDHAAFGLDVDETPIVVMPGSGNELCKDSRWYVPGAGLVYSVNKWNLRTGVKTSLGCFPIHPVTGVSPSGTDFYYSLPHKAPGWVLVSHISDNVDGNGWLPFENEIFLLKLDGSGAVLRIAHHRSRPSSLNPLGTPYGALPKPAISLDGTKVVFGSNMGLVNPTLSGDPNYQDAYVLDLPNTTKVPTTGDAKPPIEAIRAR